ncbi:DUF4044 domain-containing protein [Haloimpatiens massiliensis]
MKKENREKATKIMVFAMIIIFIFTLMPILFR